MTESATDGWWLPLIGFILEVVAIGVALFIIGQALLGGVL